MKRDLLSYWMWWGCATLWATLCFVVPDFIDNPVGNWQSLLAVITYILSVGLFQALVLYIIGLNRYACAVLLPVYALTGSVCAYYRLFYHVSITPLLLDAALHTHAREMAGVVSFGLIAWVAINLLIGIVFCIIRWRKISLRLPVWNWVVAPIALLGYYIAIPRLKEALEMRYPLNLVYSITEYISDLHRAASVRQYPSIVSSEVPDSLVVVAVLGEAARADHLQLNGYPRPTNPLLGSRPNVVSLSDVYSQYTNTNGSIPHIITRADSACTEYAYTEHSFVALFRKAGFYTVWLSNKNQTKPFWDFMDEADTIQYTAAARTQALYAKWLDGDLLPLMDGHLGQNPKQLFVLHTMGSHWLYDTHVSDELCVFQPAVTNRDVRQNTQEQIINSYDNTVLYLDAFLNDLIQRLQSRPAVLLYLSDHGESLGEGGRFLHAQKEAEEEKYPAAIVWYSDRYKERFPDKVEALHARCTQHYRTDYFFFSVLSAAGIEAEGSNETVNIFQ